VVFGYVAVKHPFFGGRVRFMNVRQPSKVRASGLAAVCRVLSRAAVAAGEPGVAARAAFDSRRATNRQRREERMAGPFRDFRNERGN
jgi:hypothetical protein